MAGTGGYTAGINISSRYLQDLQRRASEARRAGNEAGAQGWENEYRRTRRSFTARQAWRRRRGEI